VRGAQQKTTASTDSATHSPHPPSRSTPQDAHRALLLQPAPQQRAAQVVLHNVWRVEHVPKIQPERPDGPLHVEASALVVPQPVDCGVGAGVRRDRVKVPPPPPLRRRLLLVVRRRRGRRCCRGVGGRMGVVHAAAAAAAACGRVVPRMLQGESRLQAPHPPKAAAAAAAVLRRHPPTPPAPPQPQGVRPRHPRRQRLQLCHQRALPHRARVAVAAAEQALVAPGGGRAQVRGAVHQARAALVLQPAADEDDPLVAVGGAGALHYKGVAPAGELQVGRGEVEEGGGVFEPGDEVGIICRRRAFEIGGPERVGFIKFERARSGLYQR